MEGRQHGHGRGAQQPHHGGHPTDGSHTITVDSDPAGDGQPVQNTEATRFYIPATSCSIGDVTTRITLRWNVSARTPERRAYLRRTQADARYGDDGVLRRLHRQARSRCREDAGQSGSTWPGRPTGWGTMRNRVYVMGRSSTWPIQGLRRRRRRRWREYFTVPLSSIWGTALDIVDRTGLNLNKARSVSQRGRAGIPTSPRRSGVANWSARRLRGGSDPVDGRNYEAGPQASLGAAAGGEAGSARCRGGGTAARERRRAGNRTGEAATRVSAPTAGRDAVDVALAFITGCCRRCSAFMRNRPADLGRPPGGRDRAADAVADLATRVRRQHFSPPPTSCRCWQIAAAVAAATDAWWSRRPGEQRRPRIPVRGRGGRGTPRCESCSTSTTSARST